MHPWKHFCTITRHRTMVCAHCLRVGLIRQGLCHDLSKYSPSEFFVGAKYYQGSRSPNSAERERNGYSLAWMHHKGRNKHHYEYWTDLNLQTRMYEPVEMPPNYFVEMVMDRIAACKVYHGKAYQDGDALTYFSNAMESREGFMMHANTRRQLVYVLTMLRDRGEEETFRFLRSYLKGKAELPAEEPV